MTEVLADKKPKGRKLARRRQRLRDEFWPEASDVVWTRHDSKGFTTIPRILPLAMHLITRLSVKGDPARVYFDLWARSFDEGMVSVTDEEDFAYSSGYTGPRATRTWREHIMTLAKLGFIRFKEQGNRDIAHILLIDPYLACANLYAQGCAPKEWWNAFVTRISETGAAMPKPRQLPE